ncbi:MAG: hypothetical protein V1644_01660 [Candidatus Micrarchaeota archaeon]
MGILTTKSKNRRYTLELIYHGPRQRKTTELPVEKLDAVFLECTSNPSKLRFAIDMLNYPDELTGKWRRDRDLIKKCAEHNTEIWLGDLEPTKKEWLGALAELLIPAATLTASHSDSKQIQMASTIATSSYLVGKTIQIGSAALLARKGNANKRTVSRKVCEWSHSHAPIIAFRNLIMAHKTRALAEKTGYTNIGLHVGASHTGIATLLEKDATLTQEQHSAIAKRGPGTLKMYRCIYDKKAGKWNVEEHSL